MRFRLDSRSDLSPQLRDTFTMPDSLKPDTFVAVGALSAELRSEAHAHEQTSVELRALRGEAEHLRKQIEELRDDLRAYEEARTKPGRGGTVDLKLGKATFYRALAALALAAAAAFGGMQLSGSNKPASEAPAK